MSDSSAAQEKLAVWLVVVVRIAAAVEFLASFCAFWDLHVRCCFCFYLKMGDIPLPSLKSTTDKGVLFKSTFPASSGAKKCIFFVPAFVFTGICLFIISLG